MLFRRFIAAAVFCFVASAGKGQTHPKNTGAPVPVRDVDPLALDVLKAVAQPTQQAQTLRFKAMVSEEQIASNGQLVTFFHTVDVALRRPDKIHLVVRGLGQPVEVFGQSGSLTLYSPETKLSATLPAKATIDQSMAALHERGIDLPLGPFLRDDFYDIAAANVLTGYVIGRVSVFGEDVHQLAFTAPDTDWQLWVTGEPNPRFVRVEIINKNLEGHPRTIIQFLDWEFSPHLTANEFTFNMPADGKQIEVLSAVGGK